MDLSWILWSREVNNRLTGWAFGHLVNNFTHPVNQTCPLPKIAHPVNHLAHRKNIDTMIITNRQFRLKFVQNWLTVTKLETPLEHPQNWQYFSAVQLLVNIQFSLTFSMQIIDFCSWISIVY